MSAKPKPKARHPDQPAFVPDDLDVPESVTPEQFARLTRAVMAAQRRIDELEERLRQREEETMSRAAAARAARIGRAASRAGMNSDEWLAYCKRVGHDDPTVLDEKTKKRISS